MGDFVQRNDEQLEAQASTLAGAVTGSEAQYNLTAAVTLALETALSNFSSSLALHNTARAAAQSARAGKDDARRELVAAMRTVNRLAQAGPDVTAAAKEAAGLPVHDENPSPVGPPTEAPSATVERVGGTQVVLKITAPDGSVAKPAGTRGIQIFEKIVAHGEATPAHVEEMTLVDVATSGRVTRTFGPADLCKTAYYGFRYVNAKGQAGPSSVIIPAAIAA